MEGAGNAAKNTVKEDKGSRLTSLRLFRPYCIFSATAAEHSMASTAPQQHEAEAAPIPIASTHNTVKCHLNSKKY
jgi:hypothetical protein